MTEYIEIRNWDKFQHRDAWRQRVPPWIKLYTELLSDENFFALSEHRRLLLICLWLEYARTRARLPLDTRSIGRRLDMRITKADLKALNHAGFIQFSASDNASEPARLEEKREEKNNTTTRKRSLDESLQGARTRGNTAPDDTPDEAAQANGLPRKVGDLERPNVVGFAEELKRRRDAMVADPVEEFLSFFDDVKEA